MIRDPCVSIKVANYMSVYRHAIIPIKAKLGKSPYTLCHKMCSNKKKEKKKNIHLYREWMRKGGEGKAGAWARCLLKPGTRDLWKRVC